MNQLMNILELYKDNQDTIVSILNIDNQAMNTNITYEDLFNELTNCKNYDLSLSKDTLFITEGLPQLTLNILLSIEQNPEYNYLLYINQGFIGINKWLINNFKRLTDINIELDIDKNYNKYLEDKNIKVIPLGEKEFINEVLNDFIN